jgi:hypothetical protein
MESKPNPFLVASLMNGGDQTLLHLTVSSVITITGLGDHDQPDWLITMTGIRT